MMKNRESILQLLRANKEAMARDFGVTKLGLCGSYATGMQQEQSDIDIVVELDCPNHFRSFFGLKHYLERLLDHPNIDLGIEHAIKPTVREDMRKSIRYV